VWEARLERFRAEVMMVEHEPGAMPDLEQQAYRPEDVGRVAALHRTETTSARGLERQEQGRGERVRIFQKEGSGTAARAVRPVLVDLDPVDYLEGRVYLPLGADHRHLVAGPDQGAAFQPDPAVEWHRQVLDDNQDTSGLASFLPCVQRSAPGVSTSEG